MFQAVRASRWAIIIFTSRHGICPARLKSHSRAALALILLIPPPRHALWIPLEEEPEAESSEGE